MTAPLVVSFKSWDRQKYIHCPVIYILVWKMLDLGQVSDYKCKTLLLTFSCLSIFLILSQNLQNLSILSFLQYEGQQIFLSLSSPMPVPSSSFSFSQARRGTYLPSKSPFSSWVYLPDTKLLTPWLTFLESPEMVSTAAKVFYPALPCQSSPALTEMGYPDHRACLQVISEVISQGYTAKSACWCFTYRLLLIMNDVEHIKGF